MPIDGSTPGFGDGELAFGSGVVDGMSQTDGMVLNVQFTRSCGATRGAMVSCDRFWGGGNGDIEAKGAVVGCQLLAVVGNNMNGNVSWSCIGAIVAGNKIGRLKEDIGAAAGDASQWCNLLEHIKQGVADGIVHWGLVVLAAGEEVVAVWVQWCFVTWAGCSL